MHAEIEKRLAVEVDLRRAVERGEFVIHYQPQVGIEGDRITGVEALVRWQHPDRGLLLPAEFIGVAEESGLIVPLGEMVLRTACAQSRAWQEAGLPSVRMAVNLSARQFQQSDLVERVAQVLQETGLAPHLLDLEITESIAMKSLGSTITTLHGLKRIGVGIAIDDFGTGHSSLGYLRDFPVHVLKVDRSFVRDLTTDPKDAAVVAAIIGLAHTLDLEVTAEGVETEEQLAFLREHGCDEYQGYLFSKPVPAKAIARMLSPSERLRPLSPTKAAS